jgi:hypothetical protein
MLRGLAFRKQTIIIHVVVTTAYDWNSHFNQRVSEACVVQWRSYPFTVLPDADAFITVFGERDVYECHVEVNVTVLCMVGFQCRGGVLKPFDLLRFDPIVAFVVLFIG